MNAVKNATHVAEQLAVLQARRAAERGSSLESRLRLAMAETVKDPMLDEIYATDGVRLRAACFAAMSVTTDAGEKRRIEVEHRALALVSAVLEANERGVPTAVPDLGDVTEPIGLLALWREVKARARR